MSLAQVQNQTFRAAYIDDESGNTIPLSKTVNIKPRYDGKVGEHIILWNDVKMAFKNASYVRHDDTAVQFLTDDNFEFLQPLRFTAFPGVVLSVVIDASVDESATVESLKTKTSTMSLNSPQSPPITKFDTFIKTPTSPSFPNDSQTRAPQYRPNEPDNSPPPLSSGRAPQLVSENSEGINSFYNHTQPQGTDPKEHYTQGVKYYNGEGVPQNYPKAMQSFLKAANGGYADAQYFVGLMYRHGRGVTADFAQAVEWYTKAARQGQVDAQSNLGFMYKNGIGVPTDSTTAIDWMTKAAEQGHVTAQFNLGFIYSTGIAQDYSKAFGWYQKAAAQGHARAQYDLGILYRDGKGTPQDYSKAAEWLLKAAEHETPRAWCDLGELYENGRGVAQDCSEAVSWYNKAADQGDSMACYNLGRMYEDGKGVRNNNLDAQGWYEKAVAKGHADAHFKLGDMIRKRTANFKLSGSPLAKYEHDEFTISIGRTSEVGEWYTKAADLGSAAGQNALGEGYYYGETHAQNYVTAMHWFQKAADQGHAGAQYNLGNMYKYGYGTLQNHSKAFEWFLKSAEQGNVNAQYCLGIAFQDGKGTKTNYSKAVEWYKKAVEQGHIGAKENLEFLERFF